MQSSLRQPLSPLHLTANLLGLPFGLCGLAQCWSTASTLQGLPAWPGLTVWFLAGLAWLITLVGYGANVVATTFQVGASLAASFTLQTATAIIAAGSIVGAALVAALAPLGSRLRVPSVIAVNNVIAASATTRLAGGSPSVWAIALGLLATAVVWRGPRAVAWADRIAVPLMLMVGIALTVACLRMSPGSHAAPSVPLGVARGFDVVVGYQVSWILMFADYSRYTRSRRAAHR